MHITLNDTPLLSPQQIGELASALDSLHSRVLKAIERLNKDVAAKKAEIANRWKSAGIDAADKARFAQSETLAAVRQIKENSRAELDGLFREAGPTHAKLVAQRPYYDSPVKVLSRAALGDARRTAYLQQLAYLAPPNWRTSRRSRSARGTRHWPPPSSRGSTPCPRSSAPSARSTSRRR
jgi:hypothetical protein